MKICLGQSKKSLDFGLVDLDPILMWTKKIANEDHDYIDNNN